MHGWRAKIGLVVPSSNTVSEAEFAGHLSEGVSLHTARMRLEEATVEGLEQMADDLDRCLDLLGTAEVDVVAYDCTTGTMVQGDDHAATVVSLAILNVVDEVADQSSLSLDARHVRIVVPPGEHALSPPVLGAIHREVPVVGPVIDPIERHPVVGRAPVELVGSPLAPFLRRTDPGERLRLTVHPAVPRTEPPAELPVERMAEGPERTEAGVTLAVLGERSGEQATDESLSAVLRGRRYRRESRNLLELAPNPEAKPVVYGRTTEFVALVDRTPVAQRRPRREVLQRVDRFVLLGRTEGIAQNPLECGDVRVENGPVLAHTLSIAAS
jgi:hypothetical protein